MGIKLNIEFDTGNDAFAEGPHAAAEIIENLAERIVGAIRGGVEDGSGRVLDPNGNCIGAWSFEADLPKPDEDEEEDGDEGHTCPRCGTTDRDGSGECPDCGEPLDDGDEPNDENEDEIAMAQSFPERD